MTDAAPRLRGFAALSPERRRELAAKGGAACKLENRHWYKNPDIAKEAGRMGGMVSRKKPIDAATT